MSKVNTEISVKELENREILYSLYYEIIGEIKGKKIQMNKKEFEDNISNTEIPTIIQYIKESINILVNKKIEEALIKTIKDDKNEKKENSLENQRKKYENQLKYLESQIRFYIKKQLQYKIQRESFESKIKSFMEMESDFEEMKEKLKYEEGQFMDNDRKDNEIEILRRENSNLKKAIDKLEKEKLQFEKKKKEEDENIKNQIENYKKIIQKLEQSQKDTSTNSSINVNNNNQNKQNIESTNSNSSNSKKINSNMNSQIKSHNKKVYNTKKNSYNQVEYNNSNSNCNFSSTLNSIINNISNKTPKKKNKGHHKTNSMNINMEENKKNLIISKYFSNQKVPKSNQKTNKNYIKISGGSNSKPLTNRQNYNQISSVSKMYSINGKSNKSANRSTMSFRHNSKEHS